MRSHPPFIPLHAQIPVVVPTGGGGSDDDKSQSTDWTKSLSKYAPLVFVASFALSTAVTAFKDYLRKDEKKKEAAEKANALINVCISLCLRW